MALKRLVAVSERFILLLLLFSLTACVTARKPLTGIIPGREVETISSSVSISARSGERSTGGRGYLVFQRPDRFHMAVLSPFGLTVLDLFGDGDRLTCLVPSRQEAYSGLLPELPDSSVLKGLGLVKWVLAPPPFPYGAAQAGEFNAPSGERFYFDGNGLLERKVSRQGDVALYSDYGNVNGVAFPGAISVHNPHGAVVKITFEDPEINLPVEGSMLTPDLQGYRVHPLADLTGL